MDTPDETYGENMSEHWPSGIEKLTQRGKEQKRVMLAEDWIKDVPRAPVGGDPYRETRALRDKT